MNFTHKAGRILASNWIGIGLGTLGTITAAIGHDWAAAGWALAFGLLSGANVQRDRADFYRRQIDRIRRKRIALRMMARYLRRADALRAQGGQS